MARGWPPPFGLRSVLTRVERLSLSESDAVENGRSAFQTGTGVGWSREKIPALPLWVGR
jgi:hypothetical protein